MGPNDERDVSPGRSGSIVSDRLLSDEELEQLATPLSITLERAAASEDETLLPWLIEQLNTESVTHYDAYVPWIGVLQRFIVRHGGEAAHDRALAWAAEYGARPFVQAYADADLRERVERLAQRLRASGSTFTVTEDAERVRFHCDIWGPARWWREPEEWQESSWRLRAGNRYRYPSHGCYGAQPPAFPLLSGARPLTRGRVELAANLATEVQFLEMLPIELFGAPLAVIGLGDTPADPVVLDVYKDSADVPEEAYAAVGLAKPSAPSDFPVEHGARVFADEELERMATPLALRLEQAADERDWDAMRALTPRMDEELVCAKDPLGVMIAGLLSWIARHLGEDLAEAVLRESAVVIMEPIIDEVRDLEPADAIRKWANIWRAHGSTFSIEENDETFVFRGRPLGACHRMWSTAYQPKTERISDSRVRYQTFGSYDAPASFHVMRQPRPTTHGKSGYPIYSCHCVMLHEIYPIETIGRPLWVEHHPLDDPDGEMQHIHYKDPSAWPAEYYEAVGMSKAEA